jgi:hypothetical protein
VRSKIAERLRFLADRIDPSTGPRAFPGYWNHAPGGIQVTVTDGVQIYPPVPGCPLWYMAEDCDRSWEGLHHA